MSIIVFEDDRVGQLDPIAVGKPAFAVSCGGFRLIGLLQYLGLPVATRVRPHLREVQSLDYPLAQLNRAEATLWVNGRLVPSVANLHALRALREAGQFGMVRTGENIAAAFVPADAALPDESALPGDWMGALSSLNLPSLASDLPTFDYPHDIVRHHMTILGPNLEYRIAQGGYTETSDGVFLAHDAKLGDYVVTDTRRGPIVLDAGASVGPYTYLSGPAYIGPNARVIEHASIKDGVSLGHTTKVGGEIEASVVEPYSNKQHHGFLGHSYLGSWVNLGAGTCNSDLKNTYGKVNMEYRGRKVDTGMQFVGCFVGDYAKTAVNTSVFTGKTIGVCSMVYGFVTTNVPSFVNYARLFGQVTEAPVEVMIATQARMFARRQVPQRAADIGLLRSMYELTRHEREPADGIPLSTDPLSL